MRPTGYSAEHLVFSRLVRSPKSPNVRTVVVLYFTIVFGTNWLTKWLVPIQFLLAMLGTCQMLSTGLSVQKEHMAIRVKWTNGYQGKRGQLVIMAGRKGQLNIGANRTNWQSSQGDHLTIRAEQTKPRGPPDCQGRMDQFGYHCERENWLSG